jgi:hypothetical protein
MRRWEMPAGLRMEKWTRPVGKWEDDIKIGIKSIGSEQVDWIQVAHVSEPVVGRLFQTRYCIFRFWRVSRTQRLQAPAGGLAPRL